MDFEKRLEKAIQRGQQKGSAQRDQKREQELSEEDLRNRHNDFRLELSDYIESNLNKMAAHFPGFEYETIYGSRGWGGAIHRNDITRGADGRAGTFFSRIEMTVRPQNEYNVVNVAGKGTIRDKELFNWNHFVDLPEANKEDFHDKIDAWIVQYAEQFASRR